MGFLIKAVTGVVKAVVGIVSKIVGGVFGFLVGGKKKTKTTSKVDNLQKSLEPEAYRKIVFGRIAAPLDVRFWQVWGTTGDKFDEVVALATHRINAVLELYFDDKLGVDSAGVVQSTYSGVVTRSYVLGTVGQAALSVGGATQYTAAATFDGCAAIKLAWVPDEKKLPDGVPSRYTQVVEGALVYDPRRDSTQTGGSGSHRANDRSTWVYATLDGNGQPIGRNNALQALWYLLGWVIPTKDAAGTVTGEMLVAGRGVDPTDINMASFIAGANNCEVAAYYTDLVLSTGDNHTSNEDKITADGLIGRLIDPGGLWSYYANVNDTGTIAIEITDGDIDDQGNLEWNEFKGMSDQFNQVGGKFINPSSVTLFQPYAYPLVRDATYEALLGKKVRKTLDFEQVLDATLAQRLARLYLNQAQYQGELSANFLPRCMKAQAWDIVRYTSERWGWTKLFRVWRHEMSVTGDVSMMLKEINASIWSAGTVDSAIIAAAGVTYNPLQKVNPTSVTVGLVPFTGANGTLADGFRLAWAAPPINVRSTEIRYRLAGTVNWLAAGPVGRDVNDILIGPELSGALYEAFVSHITVNEIRSDWVGPTAAPANASSQFYLGTTGNVNYAAISAAGGTALWSQVTGPGRPTDFADVTGNNIASGFNGQGLFATVNQLTRSTVRPGIGGPYLSGFGSFSDRNNIAYGDPDLQGLGSLAARGNVRLNRTGNAYNEMYQGDGTTALTDTTAVTSLGIADGFRLQGALATRSSLGYGDAALTGFGSFAARSSIGYGDAALTGLGRYAARNTVGYGDADLTGFGTLAARANVRFNNEVYRANGTSLVSDADAITSLGIADGFRAQGRFATRDTITYGDADLQGFGTLAARTTARLGFEVYRNNNSTVLTDADAVTSLGIADGFRLQGPWATNATPVRALFEGKANTIKNGGFRLGFANWVKGNWTWVQGQTYEGPFIYVTNAGAPYDLMYSDLIPVYPNTVYSLQAELASNALTVGAVVADIEWWNVAGTGVVSYSSNVQIGPGSSWARLRLVATAPGTAGFCRVRVFLNSANSGGQGYARRIKLSGEDLDVPFTDELTDGAKFDNSIGRIRDPKAYNTQAILGPDNVTNIVITQAPATGNYLITLSAHNRYIAGINGPVTLAYAGCSFNVAYSTYWTAYVDDPELTGFPSSLPVVVTSNPNDLLYPGRYQIASATTPSSSGSGGTPPGSGGGGGGGNPLP